LNIKEKSMKKYQDIATLLLRFALAAGFLSAVASRLSLWGSHSSGWKNFLSYAGEVNSFAPAGIVPIIAIVSTSLETAFAILLLIGYKTRWVALGSSLLTLFFSLAMAYSFGIKEPLDYSVFAFSAAAFLLATMPHYCWSIDEILFKNK
jgi:putative oxidoreductase